MRYIAPPQAREFERKSLHNICCFAKFHIHCGHPGRGLPDLCRFPPNPHPDCAPMAAACPSRRHNSLPWIFEVQRLNPREGRLRGAPDEREPPVWRAILPMQLTFLRVLRKTGLEPLWDEAVRTSFGLRKNDWARRQIFGLGG